MTSTSQKVRLKVSPEVARVVGPDAPRDLKLSAARGALPLHGKDFVTALFFLAHGKDEEIKEQSLNTLREVPASVLRPVALAEDSHPQLLDFIARHRLRELSLMEAVLTHAAIADATLLHVAARATGAVLSLIANNDERLISTPDIIDAIFANPDAEKSVKYRLGWVDPATRPEPVQTASPDNEDDEEDEEFGEIEEDDAHKSKYQLALEFGVSDKIKMALTGDKEWRNLLLKDSNRLVSSAVMKNPRITEGEVLMVAKNKSASDELIRLINLNREWLKSYEIRKALVLHPRTPLPKALRYMTIMTEKDVRDISKSRGVSQVIVNNARRMIMAKEKKK